MHRFALALGFCAVICALSTAQAQSAHAGSSASVSDVLPQLADLPGGGVIIFGPDPYAWRVWPHGKIEFSFDSGHTWEQQKSGVTADLIAGTAPASKICWVVGKAGTILLTTDKGHHWKKLNPPTSDDLEGVNAEDAKRASVWTTGHKHSFATNDAGLTWAPNEEK